MSVTVLLLSVLKNERQQRYDKNSKGRLYNQLEQKIK